jgi:hypothetical protein
MRPKRVFLSQKTVNLLSIALLIIILYWPAKLALSITFRSLWGAHLWQTRLAGASAGFRAGGLIA